MGKSNKDIMKEFYKVVINGKNLDAIHDYFSKDCIFRGTPYVGLGIMPDTTSGDKVIVKSIAKGSPADGKLKMGDEIVAAEDKTGKWDNFEDLKGIGWGQGTIGTSLKVTIRRDGELMEVELTRGRVESFDRTLENILDSWKHFLTVECPDQKVEIVDIIEEGDLVAVYSIGTGTHTEFNRQAIWAEGEFSRFKDGKIVEYWGAGPPIEYYTQLGFKIEPPKV